MADRLPRRAEEPGQSFDYTTAEGRQRHLKADDDGAIWPKNDEDEAVLQRAGYPVHRVAADKAAKQKPAKAPAKAAAAPSPAAAPKEASSGSK